MGPAPDTDPAACASKVIQALQPKGPFEIQLGGFVEIENRCVTICIDFEAALLQEFLCESCGLFATDLELDGCFRKRAPEILDADGERRRCNDDDNADDPVIPRRELCRHAKSVCHIRMSVEISIRLRKR